MLHLSYPRYAPVHIFKEKIPIVEKKPARLVLPKLQNSCKRVRNCCKLQVISKSQNNSVIVFASKILFPKFLYHVRFTSFHVDYAMNPITDVGYFTFNQ